MMMGTRILVKIMLMQMETKSCDDDLQGVLKKLPKALRTQVLTALTSSFGLVGLVQYAW